MQFVAAQAGRVDEVAGANRLPAGGGDDGDVVVDSTHGHVVVHEDDCAVRDGLVRERQRR